MFRALLQDFANEAVRLAAEPYERLVERNADARALDGRRPTFTFWRHCPHCGAAKVKMTAVDTDDGMRRFCWSCRSFFAP